jgi:Ca2+/H+ antiporter
MPILPGFQFKSYILMVVKIVWYFDYIVITAETNWFKGVKYFETHQLCLLGFCSA